MAAWLVQLVAGAVVCALLAGAAPVRDPDDRADGTDVMAVQPDRLRYLGAFRVPREASGGSSLHYGGTALAFNATRNSLYIVGHDWHQKVAEITVPAVVNAPGVEGLDTARLLQPLTEASEGRMFTVDQGSIKVGGLMVYGGRLYGTAYSYYDADGSQTLSHYHRPMDLTVNGAEGMFSVGERTGYVSGYMTPIPPRWRQALGGTALTGQCCLAIAGRTSLGPSVSVFNPSDIGRLHPAPAAMVLGYPLELAVTGWASTGHFYNGTTQIRGLVFPEGTTSVLFMGRQGIGPFCYGTGAECNDPMESGKGAHAYPYIAQVWAYDVGDLLAVRHGQKQPWDVRPYAMWPVPLPRKDARIGGVTYDSQTQRIFVSQPHGDGTLPLIHVFTLE